MSRQRVPSPRSNRARLNHFAAPASMPYRASPRLWPTWSVRPAGLLNQLYCDHRPTPRRRADSIDRCESNLRKSTSSPFNFLTWTAVVQAQARSVVEVLCYCFEFIRTALVEICCLQEILPKECSRLFRAAMERVDPRSKFSARFAGQPARGGTFVALVPGHGTRCSSLLPVVLGELWPPLRTPSDRRRSGRWTSQKWLVRTALDCAPSRRVFATNTVGAPPHFYETLASTWRIN